MRLLPLPGTFDKLLLLTANDLIIDETVYA